MDGKQEKETAEPGTNVISKALRTVSMAALLCGAGFGIAAWYKYDGMQGIREVAGVFSGENEAETGLAEGGQEGEGQALVREVAGNVKPTEQLQENPEEQSISSETESQPENVAADQTVPSAEEAAQTVPSTEAQTDTKPAPEEAAESIAPVGAEVSYQEYVVKNGDTLSLICRDYYGTGTPAVVAEVCQFNGMDSGELIYEGQILKLPEQ